MSQSINSTAARTQNSSASDAQVGNHADLASLNGTVLIALGRGATSLRAYQFDAMGNVLATRASSVRAMNLPRTAADGGFGAKCGAWLDQRPELPVVATDMVGSAHGWKVAPYVDAPADTDSLVAGIVCVKASCGFTIPIVPEEMQRGELPNAMCGEETPIFGALAGTPPVSNGAIDANELIGLPSTHAKWALVCGACIERFYTFAKGKVFKALRAYTTLCRTMIAPELPDIGAFPCDISIARDNCIVGVLSTCTLGLPRKLASNERPDYLLGLLINDELADLKVVLPQQKSSLNGKLLSLIGNDALSERYRSHSHNSATLRPHPIRDGTWPVAHRHAGWSRPAAETRVDTGVATWSAS